MNIVIAGASSGIGEAIAQSLVTTARRIALLGRSRERLEKLRSRLEAGGARAEVYPIDLRSRDQILAFGNEITRQWDRIDIVVHAVGVWHDDERVLYGPRLHEVSPAEIENVMDVTLTAAMLLTRQLLPLMIPQRRGKIINISGTFESGAKGWLHYYVAKQGLEAFTKGLAEELRAYRIQVNCISPSDTNTEAYRRFFPGSCEEAQSPACVAEVAEFLVSRRADNISGQCIVVRGPEVSTP